MFRAMIMMPKKIALWAQLVAATACGVDTGREQTGSESAVVSSVREATPVMLFVGTSLTAGFGLTEEQAYPSLIQQKLDSAGFEYRVVNAGVSGQTSAGGLQGIDWLLRMPVAILVVELGANDGLRGQDVGAMKQNILEIIRRARASHPDVAVVLAGMEAPPNLGASYTATFRRVFSDIAADENVRLVPFLLEGVAGIDSLNQADGIHPTARGQRIVAENVWRVVRDVVSQ